MLGLMCLAQGHNAEIPVRLGPAALHLESSTLPPSHCAIESSQTFSGQKQKYMQDKGLPFTS